MSDDVITSIDQVSAAWLTSVLAQSGAIPRGAVESFEFAAGQDNWSDYEAVLKEKFGKGLTRHRVKYRLLKR